jgi:protein-S-isoprenylcysteine O-methyltransferase Ste14
MKRFTVGAYGALAYTLFLGTILYAIGFVGNVLVPKSIDSGAPSAPLAAAGVDLLLLSLFALQHSLMARPWFKRWWTRWVPASVERSTFVLCASGALLLLYWQWRPLPGPVWEVAPGPAAQLLALGSWLGWALVFLATFMINHFELFGLQQVYLRLRGRPQPEARFKAPYLYRHVRHPIYLGFLVAFWSTPRMTLGHLLFAAATTAYILLGIWFEERDLMVQFGDTYSTYRRRVGMLLPRVRATHGAPAPKAERSTTEQV